MSEKDDDLYENTEVMEVIDDEELNYLKKHGVKKYRYHAKESHPKKGDREYTVELEFKGNAKQVKFTTHSKLKKKKKK